jgi:hypothetical protein
VLEDRGLSSRAFPGRLRLRRKGRALAPLEGRQLATLEDGLALKARLLVGLKDQSLAGLRVGRRVRLNRPWRRPPPWCGKTCAPHEKEADAGQPQQLAEAGGLARQIMADFGSSVPFPGLGRYKVRGHTLHGRI